MSDNYLVAMISKQTYIMKRNLVYQLSRRVLGSTWGPDSKKWHFLFFVIEKYPNYYNETLEIISIY